VSFDARIHSVCTLLQAHLSDWGHAALQDPGPTYFTWRSSLYPLPLYPLSMIQCLSYQRYSAPSMIQCLNDQCLWLSEGGGGGTSRMISSVLRRLSEGVRGTPSSGMQYMHRRLHRSVKDILK